MGSGRSSVRSNCASSRWMEGSRCHPVLAGHLELQGGLAVDLLLAEELHLVALGGRVHQGALDLEGPPDERGVGLGDRRRLLDAEEGMDPPGGRAVVNDRDLLPEHRLLETDGVGPPPFEDEGGGFAEGGLGARDDHRLHGAPLLHAAMRRGVLREHLVERLSAGGAGPEEHHGGQDTARTPRPLHRIHRIHLLFVTMGLGTRRPAESFRPRRDRRRSTSTPRQASKGRTLPCTIIHFLQPGGSHEG